MTDVPNSQDYYRRAAFLVESGSLNQAMRVARQAAKLWPSEPHIHWLMGHIYRIKGKIPRAIDCLYRSRELAGESPRLLVEIASVQESLGQMEEAVKSVARAYRAAPLDPHVAIGYCET